MSTAADALRAAEERALRTARALDDLRDALREAVADFEHYGTNGPRTPGQMLRDVVDILDRSESDERVRATSVEADREHGLWYVHILDEPVHHTTEGAPVNLDWTRDGNLIGVEILGPNGELPAAPAPQVFFPGDTVPAGTTVIQEMASRDRVGTGISRKAWVTEAPVVELQLPTLDEWQAIVERAQAERQRADETE